MLCYLMSLLYIVYLSSPNNRQFRGFLIQARDSNGDPIGSFTVLDGSNSQTLTCFSDSDSAVSFTHARWHACCITFTIGHAMNACNWQ